MKTLTKSVRCLLTLILFASFTGYAQTITSDGHDYQPGSTATFTGTGWGAYEVVMVTVHNLTTPICYNGLCCPYYVTADANGNWSMTWTVCNCMGDSLVATATGQTSNAVATAHFTDSNILDGIDFQQPRNQGHPTDPLNWVNSVLNHTHAEYYEGMGVPQRVIIGGIAATPGNNHFIRIKHQCVKGNDHAYDFLMSWAQAVATAGAIGGSINELQDLFIQGCGGSTISAGGAAICSALDGTTGFPPFASGVFHAFASPNDTMGNPPNLGAFASTDPNVDDIITCFENAYNDRSVEIRGNAAITNFAVNFDGYEISGGNDAYAVYTLSWISAATDIMFRFAGHLSVSNGTCGYGVTRGSGAIGGAPFHFKLIDLDGNIGDKDNQITEIIDPNNPPTISCSNGGNLGCNGTVPPADTNSVTVDGGCTSNLTITSNDNDVAAGCSHTLTRTYTVTDECGATATCEQVFTYTSASTPQFSGVPTGTDLGCNPSHIPVCGDYTVTASNACGSATVTCSPVDGGSGCSHSRTFTWTATTTCGGSNTASATFTWTTATAPQFSGVPTSGFNLGCNPASIPTCTDYTVTASNECGSATVTCSPVDGGSGCSHSRTFTWTATGTCGSNTASVTYTWSTATTPQFSGVPTGIDLGCNPSHIPVCGDYTVTASNECGSVTVTCSPIDGGSGCSHSRTFTWTATTTCGGSNTASATFTWTTATAPVFDNCPAGGYLGCNNAPSCAAVTAHNECGAAPVTCSPGNIDIDGCNRSQTFTYTATATCGGSNTCSATYTWKVDTIAPAITCAPDVEQCNSGSNCITLTAPDVTADGCSNATVSRSPMLSCYPVGTTVVVWTATDVCGNSNTCSQSVIIHPTPPVTISPAGPVSVCESQDCVTLTASGADHYLWSPSGDTTASVDICPAGSYTYSVVGTTDFGCSASAGSVSVTIHPNPICGIDPLQYDANGNSAWDEAELPTANSTNNVLAATYIAEAGSTLHWVSSKASWPITGGQGTATIYFTAGPIGTSATFTLTVTSPYNCTSTCDITFTTEVHEQCAYTQGFYGNTNGQMTCVGLQAVPAIKQALGCAFPCPSTGNTLFPTCNPIVLGTGSRKLTVPCNSNAASCLNSRMPSSGSPGALPNASIDICSATGNTWLNNQDRLKNTLLGQAIALNLNLRLFPGLGNLHLTTSSFTTYGRVPGDCDPNSTSFVANNIVTKTIPQSVINCLGTNPLNNTVLKLRDLANRALGYTGNGNVTCAVLQCTGTCTPPSFADITAALAALNEGFDACRFISGFNVRMDNVSEAIINGESTMLVYPNPTNGVTSVEFLASGSSNATVSVYNIDGSLISVLFNESVTEGSAYKVNFNSSSMAPGIYFVRLVVGTEVTVSKLVVMDRE